MKVIYFGHSVREKKDRMVKPLNFERFIFTAFLAIFIILLGVQAALLNPALRSAVTVEQGLEGTPLGSEEYLYNGGSIELRLENAQSDPSLKVLVNGNEKASFDTYRVTVDVVEGDVVEIDASEASRNEEVTITSISDIFDQEYLGKTFSTDGGVLKLLKVRMPSR